MFKNTLFSLVLLLTIFFGVKINFINAQTNDIVSEKINSITSTIGDNTPSFVTNSTNFLENFRTASADKLVAQQNFYKFEKNNVDKTKVEKFFTYFAYYFFVTFSIIVSSSFLFYGLLIFALFILIRFIWRKVF